MRRTAWAPVVLALLLLSSGTAQAAPVTLDLRVEGATRTLFEGPVTTDGKVVSKGGNTLACDGTSNPGNPGPGPTVTSALDDASLAAGFGWDATFSGDFFVNSIAGEASTASQFWGIALNYRPLEVGGCQQQVAAGDEVLFAYDFFAPDFSERTMLRLDGPGRAVTGQPVPVSVDQFTLLPAPFPQRRDLQQLPASGASVAGATTGSDGTAGVTFDSSGLKVLKAERPGAIRSNSVLVCASPSGTEDCGVPAESLGAPGRRGAVTDSTAPVASISGPRHGRKYRRGRGPRLLEGTARDDGSGVGEVKLSIRRHVRGRGCQWWSGRRDRFVGRNCRKTFFFSIGKDARWSYLLPQALGPGRYVVDLKVFDARRNRSQRFVSGENRVVFEVLKPRTRKRHAGAAAAPARVETMVVGRKDVIAKPVTVRAKATKVRASGRTCAVAQSTPLAALRAALARAKVGFAVRDFGSCKERATRDSKQLFVTRIARERNSGQDGWVYKVNDRAPGKGAADSRVRTGDRLVWLYCKQDAAAGGCQRSLRVIPGKRSGRLGESLVVRVFGYDDKRKRIPITGAQVTLRSDRETIRSAVTSAAGSVLLTFPAAGTYTLTATADGLVPAFPVRIRSR